MSQIKDEKRLGNGILEGYMTRLDELTAVVCNTVMIAFIWQ